MFLIAEDDIVWQKILVSVVRAAGYQHKLVDNWPQFVNLVHHQKFSGMIVDLSLGSSSETGVETLQFVRRFNPPDTLIVFTSFQNKLIKACHSLSFVKGVIPKSKISEHLDEIGRFFVGKIKRNDLQSLTSGRPIGSQARPLTTRGNKKNVFVVHGRNRRARQELFAFLRALGLNPIEWSKAVQMTGKGSPEITNILDRAFENAGAVIVLLTGDDEARLLKKYCGEDEPWYEKRLTRQPRPNVLFEAGLAFGRNADRTILVQIGVTRPFSDIAGKHILRFKGSKENRNELANRLRTARCEVQLEGNDWLSAGNFDGLES